MKKTILFICLAAFALLAGCLENPMTLNEAIVIARASSCMEVGNLTNTSFFNNGTQTWWIDLDTVKPGCAPACVVYLSNKSAEVNWRCTGVIPQVNLTEDEARQIASESDCMKEGGLKNSSFYNENSRTWWFDMDVVKPGCNPACVVFEENRSTEINWRCTGLIPINATTQCWKPCHIYIENDYNANPPTCMADVLACTMEYRAGDACLKYVNCAAKDNGCETTLDQKFSECLSCFKDAAAGMKNQSECEQTYQ